MTEPKKRATENLNVWVRTELGERLRTFVEKARPRVSKTAFVEDLLELGLSMPPDLLDALREAAAGGWSDLSGIVRACAADADD